MRLDKLRRASRADRWGCRVAVLAFPFFAQSVHVLFPADNGRFSTSMKLLKHQAAWLKSHPDRSVKWLRERFKDGFDVHHLDGDHSNNDPGNLVLIDHVDHMRLHGIITDGEL